LTTGAGYYWPAVATTAIALFSLWPLRIAAHVMISRFRPVTGRLLVQLPTGQSAGALVDEVERMGAKLEALEVGQEGDRRTVALDLGLSQDADVAKFVAQIADVEHVLDVQWMR
jgi:hypothetical protein